MIKIKLKTLRMKILVSSLPIVVLAMLILTLFSFNTSRDLINKEIDYKMNNQLDHVIANVNITLTNHSKIPLGLAYVAETAGNTMLEDQYKSILEKFVGQNADTFGGGIWFEPYKYDSNLKYF